mgnify:CR=1 FL=1
MIIVPISILSSKNPFTLSPDFGKRIILKTFFENRLFRKRLWKTDSSFTKNGPAHNRAGPFR